MRTTEWYPHDARPVREGWYDVKVRDFSDAHTFRMYFDGVWWWSKQAADERTTSISLPRLWVWRGLALEAMQDRLDETTTDLVKILCVLQAVEPRVRSTKFFIDLAVKYGHQILDKNTDEVIRTAQEISRCVRGVWHA